MTIVDRDSIRVWPARAVIDGQTHPTVRVDTHNGVVRVWGIVDNEPALVAEIPRTEVTALRVSGARSYVSSDGRVTINKRAGCGCSHRLARFRPPKDV